MSTTPLQIIADAFTDFGQVPSPDDVTLQRASEAQHQLIAYALSHYSNVVDDDDYGFGLAITRQEWEHIVLLVLGPKPSDKAPSPKKEQ